MSQQIQLMEYRNLNSHDLKFRIKNLQSIGKLFNKRYSDQANPQEAIRYNNHLISNRLILSKSIATNTPRSRKLLPLLGSSSQQFTKQIAIGKIVSPKKIKQILGEKSLKYDQLFTNTKDYFKRQGTLYRPQFQRNVSKQQESLQSSMQINQQGRNQGQQQKQFIIGQIKDLSKIKRNSLEIGSRSASSEFPYIQKINNSVNGFRSFMGKQGLSSFQMTRSGTYPVTLHNENSAILAKNDPNYESSLVSHSKKQYVHLPMYKYDTSQGETGQGQTQNQILASFHSNQYLQKDQKQQEQKAQRIEHKDLQLSIRAHKQPQKHSQNNQTKINQQYRVNRLSHSNKGTFDRQRNHLNSFKIKQQVEVDEGYTLTRQKINELTYSRSKKGISQSTIIGMQTSLATLKQLLILSKNSLDVSFRIPDSFMKPPSANANQKDLQMLMIEVFNYVNLKPRAISIYKFSNCVMLKQKDLCVLWHFNGKVYFGGWKNQAIGVIGDGKKHGLGLQWVPQRYVYYGEFLDGKKSGYGIMKKFNKEVYLGEWKQNQRHGWGKVFEPEGGNILDSGQFYEGKHIKQGYLH